MAIDTSKRVRGIEVDYIPMEVGIDTSSSNPISPENVLDGKEKYYRHIEQTLHI